MTPLLLTLALVWLVISLIAALLVVAAPYLLPIERRKEDEYGTPS